MTKRILLARCLAAKRPFLSLDINDRVGLSDFMNPDCHSGAAAIFNHGNLVGILTERDLLKRVLARNIDPREISAGDIMTPNPVFVSADSDLKEVLHTITESGFRYLPVMSDNKVIGMIDVRDLYVEVQNLMKEAFNDQCNVFAGMMSEPYGRSYAGTIKQELWPWS